jgi:putative glycosyltransferase
MMYLSIVTTLYQSAPHIEEFYSRVTASAKEITQDYEVIFVDDGSPDDSLNKALDLCKKDFKVKVVELSRNFGHHEAIMVGLEHCSGKYVFLLDVDLEEAPEWLNAFYTKQQTHNVDVVVGVQTQRSGGVNKRLGGQLFYKVFNWLSSTQVPEGVTIARIMTRRYVESLISHTEKELFFAGLCELTGYQQLLVEVDKPYKGTTSYSFTKRLKQAVSAIASFSNRPLYLVFSIGLFIFLGAVASIAVIIFQKVFYSLQLGYASLVASIWGMGGILMMSVGVLGIYLAKIYSEVKKRPTIVKNIYQQEKENR